MYILHILKSKNFVLKSENCCMCKYYIYKQQKKHYICCKNTNIGIYIRNYIYHNVNKKLMIKNNNEYIIYNYCILNNFI